jgi:hypothetical protein
MMNWGGFRREQRQEPSDFLFGILTGFILYEYEFRSHG